MQKRSRSMVNSSEQKEKNDNEVPINVQNNGQQNPKSSAPDILGGLLGGTKNGELFNIGGFRIDEEKALIGLLIYILYKQGADVKLLLGLGYLLL